jgi:hypothetical protein
MLIIKRQEFVNLLKEDFPEDYEKFCFIRDVLLYSKDQALIGKKCSSCNSTKHTFLECDLIHFYPDPFFSI